MKFRQILNPVLLVITLVVNWASIAIPLGGMSTAQISDSFPVLFVPAGYVFSIWSVIYTALIAFVIYQALPSQRNNPRLERIGYWFALSNLFNSAWIFAWQYRVFYLTVPLMLGLLLTLIVIYQRLRIGLEPTSTREAWLVNLPFSLYLGWISVATIANISDVLYLLRGNDWGLPPQVWAALLLLVGAVLAMAMVALRRETVYPMVIIWAFVGILVKQSGTPFVAITAGVAAGVVFLFWFATRILKLGWASSPASS